MRKCEIDMLRAVVSGRNWKTRNTEVVHDYRGTRVYLHGTCVGEIRDGNLTVSNGGYRTTTTKSRINALLRLGWRQQPHYQPYVYQSNWKWYFRQPDDRFVDWTGQHTVPMQDIEGWWFSDAISRH